MRRQDIGWEQIFAKDTSDKGLFPKQTNNSKFNKKKANNPIKDLGQRSSQMPHQRYLGGK